MIERHVKAHQEKSLVPRSQTLSYFRTNDYYHVLTQIWNRIGTTSSSIVSIEATTWHYSI
jgi:hypothetical protein